MRTLLTVLLFASTFAVISFETDTAQAGCKVSVYAKNTGEHRLKLYNGAASTGAKSKSGSWRSLHAGYWFRDVQIINLNKDQRKGHNYSATFGCNAKRRYRVFYKCLGGSQNNHDFTAYYPSATGWTKKTNLTINLPECK